MNQEVEIGWIPELDIPTAIRNLPSALPDSLVLISMIDSTPDVAELPSVRSLLERHGAYSREVNSDVLIEYAVLTTLIEKDDFFTGFDEVWLFSDPPDRGKPADCRLTSDQPLEGSLPSGIKEWMASTGCIIGLGDGIGLNFVTADRSLVPLLRGHDA